MQSCTDKVSDDEAAPVSDDRVEWKMVLDSPVSRAVTHADGSGYFEEGDTLVVFARNVADGRVQHYTLHLSNGEWIPKVYWREIGEEVQFTAWYLPVARQLHLVSQTSSDYLHTLAVSQQGDGYGQSDLLCAQARVRSGVPVQLSLPMRCIACSLSWRVVTGLIRRPSYSRRRCRFVRLVSSFSISLMARFSLRPTINGLLRPDRPTTSGWHCCVPRR